MRHPRIVLSTILLLAGVLLIQQPIRRSALSILRFPFTLLTRTASALASLPTLPARLAELEELRTALVHERLESARLREELRHANQVALLSESNYPPHAFAACVIDRSRLPTQRTILINEGKRRGVTLTSVILDIEGVVGRVIELYPTTALVLLLTDPESRVAGMVERSRETGLLVGRATGYCELIYLDEHADIKVNDRIVTAGLGGIFPKGLTLGTVQAVMRDSQRGSAWAHVRPAANLTRVEDVLCLPSSPNSP